MKIQDKKRFTYAIATLIFAIILFTTLFFKYETKLLISGFTMLLISVVSFKIAFSKSNLDNIETLIDERDIYIVRKTSQTSIKIINNILFLGGLLFVLLYVVTKVVMLLTVGVTLIAVDIVVFSIVLLVNCYYERHE